ncbi:MAG: hypothetical protein LKJ90_07660 [Faecalibacterium sp.]|jgi:hypothetical protein|nr:hypothetical protein [Faecalibacterium sp.]
MNTNEKLPQGGRHAKPATAQPADGHARFAFFLQHLGWGARMLLAVAAISPIFFFMVWFNYTVDCSGLFHGDVYTREIAAMLLAGQNVDGYETMDERSLTKLTIEQMDAVPSTVALGSSRVMQMTRDVAGTEDFYNFGMTGGDFYDLLGTFELFEEKGSLPQNVILCIDPWLLNGTGSGDTSRSDRNLYQQFLSERLGEDVPYTVKDENALWKALVSPSYFQGNWKYWRHDRRTQAMPQAVLGADYDNSPTEIKNCDGSVHYTAAMLSQTPEQTAQYALDMAGTYAWCDGFTEPDAERVRLLKEYIAYMQDKGIHVYILLTPMHPIMYEYALTYPDDNIGFLRSEDAIRTIAAETNVPVYGSYNPHILPGVDAGTDFYDGVHCTSECLKKFWPGIEQARADEAAGIAPSAALLNTVDNDIYAELTLRCGAEKADEMAALLPLERTAAAAA